MLTQRSRNVAIYLLALIGIIVLFILAWMTTQIHSQLALAIVLGLGISLLSFVRQDIAAIAILLSMVLSPEISLASLPGREVVVRFDDVILVTFFTSWLFKMAYFKNLGFLKVTALNAPIWSYILVALVSTWKGAGAGNLQPASSILYFAKYVEYFMIFFMFSNIIQTAEQAKKFLGAFFAAAGVVSLYGYYQIVNNMGRISAPFEGGSGQANTFGGYLLMFIGISVLAAIKSTDRRIRIAALISTANFIILLVMTFSRASYLGFLAMIPGFIYFARPKQRLLIFVSIIVALAISPLILPKRAKDRIQAPFSGETEQVAPFLRLNRQDSSFVKVYMMKEILRQWAEEPILGKGVTGVGLVDTQYARILGEMGLLGVFAFIWILFAITQIYNRTMRYLNKYPESEVWHWRAVSTGYICAGVGLFVHGFGANTFVLIRIMEPFWFLTALVAAIPYFLENKKKPVSTEDTKPLTFAVYHTGHEKY